MPSHSESQRRLMAAAEHGADFPKARELRKHMSMKQLHDFAVKPGGERLPERVEHKRGRK